MTRRLPSSWLFAAVALLFAALVAPPQMQKAADPRTVRIGLTRVLAGLSSPVTMAHVPDGSGRYVIGERAGRLRMVRGGVLQSRPFLDISGRVLTAGEAGLLSIAFPPNFTSTGHFFVTYVDRNNNIRLSRFTAPQRSDVAYTSEMTFLSIAHPTHQNHYGGQIAFGPRSLLYMSTGDGGGSGDPAGNAQNLRTLLGKVLRIDISRASNGKLYSIPSGNPFATSTTNRREIWLWGMRNPWKFSFDRGDASHYIGDVGQYVMEEINWLPRETGGRNMGWDCREGTLNVSGQWGGSYCSGKTFTGPVRQYNHDLGCAVIGGYAYRGTRYASLLDGVYIYGDFCSGRIWGLARQSNGSWLAAQLYDYSGNILSFGQDAGGEVYVLAASGEVFRIAASRR